MKPRYLLENSNDWGNAYDLFFGGGRKDKTKTELCSFILMKELYNIK